ncbi:MAG: hypothetical protein M3362_21015, partial [Acidobacteriota bacterium]|nr:hypothetical protein [Acidobacteriota bacterium]
MSTSVVLVTAPFLSVVRPSLGVSNLKAALSEAGISSRIEYLNISYADQIGVDLNEYITEKLPNILLVGEWVFSELVNRRPSPASAVEHIRQMRQFIPEAKLKEIASLRSSVAQFVEESARRLV